MHPFFQVQSLEQVLDFIRQVEPISIEKIPLAKAVGRVLAKNLIAPHNLPGFTRACMDGFAVVSSDTFGASETLPVYLFLVGEVYMGQSPNFVLSSGQCARIMTGGELPLGADAVIMAEYTRYFSQSTIEIIRPITPGGHTIGPCDDISLGQKILSAGQRLRPQDIGLLAAIGIELIEVMHQPQVGIISTGDEVVPLSVRPKHGQIRDINTYTLTAAVAAAGGIPRILGLTCDNESAIKAIITDSLVNDDLTLVSGGSSIGTRDFTLKVFTSMPKSELLVHGVAIAPGKPFIWVRIGNKNLLGLPGQVASCLISFYILVEPLIESLLGRSPIPFSRFGRVKARLMRNLSSVYGREEYLRVRLIKKNNQFFAEPVFGKSGLLRILVESDGLVKIERDHEGLIAGCEIEVLTWPINSCLTN